MRAVASSAEDVALASRKPAMPHTKPPRMVEAQGGQTIPVLHLDRHACPITTTSSPARGVAST
jgi:hypothetical protein